ncbi:MAG: CotH kinase family protein [Lachnospiraceae bacterium]|nr:CotH kinase family protein [Lachnospiraceae bacterium]
MVKKIALMLSVLAFIALVVTADVWNRSTVMDAQVLSENAFLKIQKDRTQVEDSSLGTLYINDVRAAWEQTEERYYIPKNTGEDSWKGTVSATLDGNAAAVVWKEDSAFQDMENAIEENHEFSCMIYTDSSYAIVRVLFTGMPLISIEGNMGEGGTRVTVYDPIYSLNDAYDVQETLAYYNIRGNASKRFEKICYRLEFFEEDGVTGNDISLLGMRSDNDWHLKAMYSDRSKLRDKLSIELWNQIADLTSTQADTGCRMEYIEVIINGEYRGLYGLVEPTDYKSLGLDKETDLIYKVRSDERPDDSLFETSEAEGSFTCAGVTIRQAGKTFYSGIWDPFRTLWDNGYEMESEEDLESLYSVIDRDNFIDYELYMNVIMGVDNRYKNIYYSTDVEDDGSYTIRRVPWDQNYSWGDNFDSDESEDADIKNICYDEELATRWLSEDIFSNMLEYDEGLAADMLEVWQEWREDFLQEDDWKAYAQEQMEYLNASGAFARDSEKWPDSENVADTEEIERYIDTRFVWLDEYLSELAEQ